MARHWIEDEFARTGLPKSALAEYLGLDNAAVSRVISLERQMTSDEIGLARAFFSIVPKGVSEDEHEAIQRLRSVKIRDTAALTLAEFLVANVRLARGGPDEEILVALVLKVASRTASLSADQIVALCRLFKIEVGGLIRGRISSDVLRSIEGSRIDVLTELRAQARLWANEREPIYEFDRKAEPTIPRVSAKTNVITLQPAGLTTDDLTKCESFLIPDDSYAPRFEQGQTIFLDVNCEPRKGDYVAAVLSDPNSEAIKAMLGKLIFVGRDTIGISSAKNIRAEIPLTEVASLRRITYCKM